MSFNATLGIVSRLFSNVTALPVVQMVMMNSTVPVNPTLKLILYYYKSGFLSKRAYPSLSSDDQCDLKNSVSCKGM